MANMKEIEEEIKAHEENKKKLIEILFRVAVKSGYLAGYSVASNVDELRKIINNQVIIVRECCGLLEFFISNNDIDDLIDYLINLSIINLTTEENDEDDAVKESEDEAFVKYYQLLSEAATTKKEE